NLPLKGGPPSPSPSARCRTWPLPSPRLRTGLARSRASGAPGRRTMHPFEKESTDLPLGVSPHLDVRLKPGWRFDRRRRALVSEAGQSVSLPSLLPSGTQVAPMATSLADADQHSLPASDHLPARAL